MTTPPLPDEQIAAAKHKRAVTLGVIFGLGLPLLGVGAYLIWFFIFRNQDSPIGRSYTPDQSPLGSTTGSPRGSYAYTGRSNTPSPKQSLRPSPQGSALSDFYVCNDHDEAVNGNPYCGQCLAWDDDPLFPMLTQVCKGYNNWQDVCKCCKDYPVMDPDKPAVYFGPSANVPGGPPYTC